MPVTEPAIFFNLHSVWMRFLIFGGIVIALLAFGASQNDFCSHGGTLFSHILA
jgi:hypothetical protein